MKGKKRNVYAIRFGLHSILIHPKVPTSLPTSHHQQHHSLGFDQLNLEDPVSEEVRLIIIITINQHQSLHIKKRSPHVSCRVTQVTN